MPRWKWFQRENEPVDVVQPATAYPDRTGAHAKRPERPGPPPARGRSGNAEPDRPDRG